MLNLMQWSAINIGINKVETTIEIAIDLLIY